MKSFYLILVLSFFTIPSIGQSKKAPQFQLTSNTLEALSVTKQVISKKESVDNELSFEQEKLINFNRVISFKEDKDYLSILTEIDDLSQLTVFTIYQPENISINSDLWMIYGEDSFISLSTDQIENSGLQTSYKGGLNKTPLLNTYTQMYKSKSTSLTSEDPHMLLGNFSNDKQQAFKGVIAEILIYNKVLRGKKRQIIEAGLALKYGITLTNGKDYLSSSKKEIYNMKDNDGFIHRISGIGRDDNNSLYQKQSHSTAEASLITIGLGDIMLNNDDNKSELNNHTFLIWGDNNKDPVFESKKQSSSHAPLMQRQWKIQVTGETISELSTTVELDVSTILKGQESINDYLLIIDQSGEGNFLLENVKYIEASSTEDNILVFKDVKWDMDESGNDSFTFALKSELELTLEEVKPLVCKVSNNGILRYQVNGGIPPYHFEFSKDNMVLEQWESTNNKYTDNNIESLDEGIYKLKVTDALLDKLDLDYILIPPTPIAIDLGEDRRFTLNDNEIRLDASITSEEEISYLWSSNKGFTSNLSRIIVTEPGLYTVTATTEKGCSASDTIKIENSIIESFIVYPNQSQDGNYNIQIKLSQKEDIMIKVFDMMGRHLSTIKGRNKSMYSIPGKHIPASGIYIIILESATQNESRKLIVE